MVAIHQECPLVKRLCASTLTFHSHQVIVDCGDIRKINCFAKESKGDWCTSSNITALVQGQACQISHYYNLILEEGLVLHPTDQWLCDKKASNLGYHEMQKISCIPVRAIKMRLYPFLSNNTVSTFIGGVLVHHLRHSVSTQVTHKWKLIPAAVEATKCIIDSMAIHELLHCSGCLLASVASTVVLALGPPLLLHVILLSRRALPQCSQRKASHAADPLNWKVFFSVFARGRRHWTMYHLR